MGLAYCSKQLVFVCLEQDLRWGWKVKVWRRGSTKNLWRRGVVAITTTQLHSTKPELRFCACSNPARVRDSRWWGSLTMVTAGKKPKHLSLVNHTTKTIHHLHHHHHHLFGQKLLLLQLDDQTNYLFWQPYNLDSMRHLGFNNIAKSDTGIISERIQPSLPKHFIPTFHP